MSPRSLNVLTVTGLAHWASYLVNADCSGLEPREKAEADEWFRSIALGFPAADSVHVVDVGESYLGHFNGLLSDLAEYTLHVHTPAVVTISVESGAIRQVLYSLHLAAHRADQLCAETAEQARAESNVVERGRLENMAANHKRHAADARDAAAEIREALPMGQQDAHEQNGEGMTFEQWRAAARAGDSKDYRIAWRLGEDPSEWLAR